MHNMSVVQADEAENGIQIFQYKKHIFYAIYVKIDNRLLI